MNKITWVLITISLVVVFCTPAHARSKRGRTAVYTKSGKKFEGRIVSENEKILTMRVEGGATITIPASIVDRKVELVNEAKFQLLVVFDKDLAKRIHEELRMGRDFTELARKYSMDISVFNDGLTDWYRKEDLPEEVSKFVFDLRKGGYCNPVEIKDKGSFYIVKLLDKREVEAVIGGEEPAPENKEETGQGEQPPLPELEPAKVGILSIAETTREATAAYLGSDVRDLLVSIFNETTGIEAVVYEEQAESEEKPGFTVSGEVAKRGAAYAVQFWVYDKDGSEVLRTNRLTAVCPADSVDDLVKAIRKLSEVMVKRVKPPGY